MVDEPITEIQTASQNNGNRTRQRFNAAAATAWHGFVDWLTPPKCVTCREEVTAGATLCLVCWSKLHFIDEPVCDMLGTPFEFEQGETALSPAAIADPAPWDRARSAVAFDDGSKQLVHLLKYRDMLEAGIAMAKMMLGPGRKLLADCDVILPVPLYRLRLWQRRFNQAAYLAQQLSNCARKPWHHDVLLRRSSTRPQVGLTADQRHKNVRRAFEIAPEKRAHVDGKHVLLVDDVRTTGATAAACAATLRQAGACRVDVLTFALVLAPARLHIES